jgi:thymidylate kinase
MIQFDGPDGVGKSVQLAIFAKFLSEKGYNIKTTKALGGDGTDWVQTELRKFLLDPKFPADDAEVEEKLFAIADGRNLKASRQFLEESNSNIVICDRGICSHVVYALAKDIDPNDLASWHGDLYNQYDELANEFGGLNVILVPEDEKMAMERVQSRGIQVTPRLENLDMQRAVIAGMRRVDRNDTLEGSFVSDLFDTVVIEVGRSEGIEAVTTKILTVLRQRGYGV